ncbi:LptA/OstA family protein [Rubrimonas cliftonensis]|uniref:Lipopolysaccharide export system protein LptA n=1 Tax=Rubrimonas cliftonensis TaxID=89524 RepID=A0A1H4A687_9RHOB|nr:LptA/OstA family protein [Rubrimonas cliftonensis]SEA31437.1 lipopolysaccharide export system protein LptA [Rubrimonas cliftonensis]
MRFRTATIATALGAALVWGVAAGSASAQAAGSPFGGFRHDSSEPIEITADALEVSQADGRATFSGDVVAGQGRLRLTSQTLDVWYVAPEGAEPSDGDIDRLRAEGDVFLSSGAETARGAWAEYSVAEGVVTMGGGVVLSQGENAIRGERLTVDLNAGQGRIEGGRVQSVFRPATNGGASP